MMSGSATKLEHFSPGLSPTPRRDTPSSRCGQGISAAEHLRAPLRPPTSATCATGGGGGRTATSVSSSATCRSLVLDVDGPLGEVSLQTLLDQAGSTALPETYTVTTGRADGGRHLWYRLTDQQEKLVNQLGAHYPQTPHLDVLFQGLVVGAGSLHKTGATYVSDSSLPPPSELAELPMMLFQPLARRGKRRDESGARTRPKKTRKSAPAALGPAVVAPEGFTPPPVSGHYWLMNPTVVTGELCRRLPPW